MANSVILSVYSPLEPSVVLPLAAAAAARG